MCSLGMVWDIVNFLFVSILLVFFSFCGEIKASSMSAGFYKRGFSGLNLKKSGRLEQYTKRTAFTIFKGIFWRSLTIAIFT